MSQINISEAKAYKGWLCHLWTGFVIKKDKTDNYKESKSSNLKSSIVCGFFLMIKFGRGLGFLFICKAACSK